MGPVPGRILIQNRCMDSASSRSLRLLALLHTGRRWTVAQLASRLGVASRTVRRDVARLRTLGYDVQSHPGPGGAYALAPSIKIPPLLLDADEVCTLVTGLLLLEAGHADDSATIVRTKLEQLLPPSLRQRAVATAAATQVLTTTHTVHWPALGRILDTRHTTSPTSPSSTGSTATLAALHNTPTDVLGHTGTVRQTTPWSWIRQAPFGPVLSSRYPQELRPSFIDPSPPCRVNWTQTCLTVLAASPSRGSSVVPVIWRSSNPDLPHHDPAVSGANSLAVEQSWALTAATYARTTSCGLASSGGTSAWEQPAAMTSSGITTHIAPTFFMATR